ncbi:hypothetical protein BH23ACT3_BH23ACT3_01930 [soil metagenome]
MSHWWEHPIRRLVSGRRVILAGGVAPVWVLAAPLVRRLGAAHVLVVATEGRGMGPAPDEPTVTVEPPPGLSLMDTVRFGVDTLREPPEEVRTGVTDFDPHGEAVVIGMFLNESPALFGRPFVSHRRPAWVALEDKTVIDQLWDDADVARAASETVALPDAADTARRIDLGDGTVWALDARGGWHGGGHLTRWVRNAADAAPTAAELARHGTHVRVMPFLDGVPCSIHGIVCDDGVAVLRPVEMVTLRRGHDLFYAGCATFWDPPDALRAEMRAVGRAVGDHLAARVAFRGGFTVDGVATVDGFRPTELNPRPGAGLGVLGRGLPDGFPLLLLLDLIAGGVDVDRSAQELEDELLTAADRSRAGGTWRFGLEVGLSITDEPRWFVDGEWTDIDTAGAPGATLGAGARGVRLTLDPATWPAGPSVAPAAAALYRHLDEHHGTSFGPLTPAPDVTA